jgi:multisubunit Na+/H+ antiporter MnhE subunit
MFLFKVALQYAFFSFFIGLLWVVMTNQPNPFGFGLGFGIGFLLLVTLRGKRGLNIRLIHLPKQLGWALLYLLVLTRDIVISGWDVSLRILGLRPIKSGIIKVPIGDKRPEVGALTAHGITITPGQLVVEFDRHDNVYVHCLDVDSSAQTIAADQARRLKFYQGMMGDDVA